MFYCLFFSLEQYGERLQGKKGREREDIKKLPVSVSFTTHLVGEPRG